MTRYLLDSDDDGHWYLIPELAHPAFSDWVETAGADPMPDGVISLGSHPSTVTFERPEHFGEPVGDKASDVLPSDENHWNGFPCADRPDCLIEAHHAMADIR